MQFSRLAIVLRQSGRSIFTRIPAIDLSTAHDAAYSLDFDLDDEEAELEDRRAAGGDLGAKPGSIHPGSRAGTPLNFGIGGNKTASSSQAFLLTDDEDIDELENGVSNGRGSKP